MKDLKLAAFYEECTISDKIETIHYLVKWVVIKAKKLVTYKRRVQNWNYIDSLVFSEIVSTDFRVLWKKSIKLLS